MNLFLIASTNHDTCRCEGFIKCKISDEEDNEIQQKTEFIVEIMKELE